MEHRFLELYGSTNITSRISPDVNILLILQSNFPSSKQYSSLGECLLSLAHVLFFQSFESFLRDLAKLRKPIISFIMSVHPSAWNNSAPTGRIFIKIWAFFETQSKFKFHYYLTRIARTLSIDQCTFCSYLTQFFLSLCRSYLKPYCMGRKTALFSADVWIYVLHQTFKWPVSMFMLRSCLYTCRYAYYVISSHQATESSCSVHTTQ
jgi:hypothetical protein